MKVLVNILVIALLLFSVSCTQTDFVQENLKTFHEFKLKNGIPVIVKVTKQSRIQSIVCALKGGKALVPTEKSGLDKVLLRLMAMESKNYSDITRRAILKKTSATISASADLDFTHFYLKTIDTYFDETFDLYADLFMNPTFPEKFFNEVITNMKNQYRSDLTDGYARVSFAVNNSFFNGHPYYSYLYNLQSIENIKHQDIQKFYQNNYVASRTTLFAAGDFNIPNLQKKLDDTFGNMVKGTPYDIPLPDLNGKPNLPLILDAYEELKKEVSYVRGNFAVIPITHKDFWALTLSTKIVSDIMNDIIRTKNSMVYSVWSYIYRKKSNYANITAYRTNNPIKVIDLITESIDIASSGKCLSPYKGNGYTGDYVSIAEGLDFYKRSFATNFYSGLQDNTSIAMKMADSYMLTGDYTNYLRVMDRIKDVSAVDVQRAASTYIKNASKYWAITAHPDTIELIKKNYRSYASTYRMMNFQ